MTDEELEELFNKSIKKVLDEIKKEFEKLMEVNSGILETKLEQFKIEFNNLLKQGLKIQLKIPQSQISKTPIIVPTFRGIKNEPQKRLSR